MRHKLERLLCLVPIFFLSTLVLAADHSHSSHESESKKTKKNAENHGKKHHHHHHHHEKSDKTKIKKVSAHSHGTGKVNLVIEGDQVLVEMSIPANDVVGFEHQPSKEKEIKKVKSANQSFQNHASILTWNEQGGCQLNDVKVTDSPLKKGGSHHEHGHSEFRVKYSYSCKETNKLSQLKFGIFNQFGSLKNLKVQGVTSSGVISKTATKSSSTVNIN